MEVLELIRVRNRKLEPGQTNRNRVWLYLAKRNGQVIYQERTRRKFEAVALRWDGERFYSTRFFINVAEVQQFLETGAPGVFALAVNPDFANPVKFLVNANCIH